MDFQINNEFGYDKEYTFLNDVINKTMEFEKIVNPIFSITFVDENEIQRINKEYRHIDKVTDVISFAFEDNKNFKGEKIRVLGDIFICIPRMMEQANLYGHSEKRELSFLTVHGLLHLLGYDHMTEKEEEIMFTKQELILDATNIKR